MFLSPNLATTIVSTTRTASLCPTSVLLPAPQVPNFVAKRWKACCEQSAEHGQQQGRKLATLRLVQAPDESGATRTQYQLQLDGGHAGAGEAAGRCVGQLLGAALLLPASRRAGRDVLGVMKPAGTQQ